MLENQTFFLIYLSGFTLLVYINTTILILYPVTLPKLFMCYSSFLVASLGFSLCSIILPVNSDIFTSFPVWIPFIFFLQWFLCLGPLKLCSVKVARVGMFILLLTWEGVISVVCCWVWFSLLVCHMAFIVRCVPSMYIFWRFFFFLKSETDAKF